MAKENFTPLWKVFLFPAFGLAANITLMCVYGLPPTFWGLLALVFLVGGSVWVYTNYEESGDQDTTLPMVITTAGPLLSMIIGYAN